MIKYHGETEWHYRRPVGFSDPIWPDGTTHARIDYVEAKTYDSTLNAMFEDVKYTIRKLKKLYCSSGDIEHAQIRWKAQEPPM